MPRLEERETNEASSVLLFYIDKELNGDMMFEIRRWSNEKRVGMKPGK
jgi:hypothetical protein